MLDESNNLDNNDLNNMETPEAPPPEESNNRVFLIVGGIFAALILLTLVCGAGYVFWLSPRLNAQKNSAQATIQAGNAKVVQQMTSTAQAALWTPTSPPTFTPTITNTAIPVVVKASATPVVALSSPTYTVTSDTSTLVAMQTQLAVQMTSTALAKGTPAAALATTGFFDEVGLPSLIVLTLALVAVIFLARRLRRAPAK
jgi:uncharacterized membrane protein YeiB